MTFQPKLKGKKEKVLAFLCAAAAVTLILLSGIVNRFGGLYQISAIVLGVISIEIYLKYVGSNYVYEAADDAFKIYRITGKRSICVSSLDYEMSLSYVVSKHEYNENKDKFPSYNFNVNLCKNLSPEEYCVYFFEFSGKKSMLKFEPDDAFIDYINKKIALAWESADNDNDYDE